MSPQSWRPSSSLSSYYNIENPNDKKIKTQFEKPKPENSKEPIVNNKNNNNNNNNISNETKNSIVTKKSTTISKTPVPTKLISQSVDFKNSVKMNTQKEVVNKNLELKRHKTFISPTSNSLKLPTKS